MLWKQSWKMVAMKSLVKKKEKNWKLAVIIFQRFSSPPPLPWPLQSWPVPTCPFQPRPDPSWPNLPARASSQAKIFSGLFHFISTPTSPPHNLPLLMRYVKIIPKRKKIKVPKQCSLCENITYGSTFTRTNLWRWNLPFNKDKIEGVISPQIILYCFLCCLIDGNQGLVHQKGNNKLRRNKMATNEEEWDRL